MADGVRCVERSNFSNCGAHDVSSKETEIEDWLNFADRLQNDDQSDCVRHKKHHGRAHHKAKVHKGQDHHRANWRHPNAKWHQTDNSALKTHPTVRKPLKKTDHVDLSLYPPTKKPAHLTQTDAKDKKETVSATSSTAASQAQQDASSQAQQETSSSPSMTAIKGQQKTTDAASRSMEPEHVTLPPGQEALPLPQLTSIPTDPKAAPIDLLDLAFIENSRLPGSPSLVFATKWSAAELAKPEVLGELRRLLPDQLPLLNNLSLSKAGLGLALITPPNAHELYNKGGWQEVRENSTVWVSIVPDGGPLQPSKLIPFVPKKITGKLDNGRWTAAGVVLAFKYQQGKLVDVDLRLGYGFGFKETIWPFVNVGLSTKLHEDATGFNKLDVLRANYEQLTLKVKSSPDAIDFKSEDDENGFRYSVGLRNEGLVATAGMLVRLPGTNSLMKWVGKISRPIPALSLLAMSNHGIYMGPAWGEKPMLDTQIRASVHGTDAYAGIEIGYKKNGEVSLASTDGKGKAIDKQTIPMDDVFIDAEHTAGEALRNNNFLREHDILQETARSMKEEPYSRSTLTDIVNTPLDTVKGEEKAASWLLEYFYAAKLPSIDVDKTHPVAARFDEVATRVELQRKYSEPGLSKTQRVNIETLLSTRPMRPSYLLMRHVFQEKNGEVLVPPGLSDKTVKTAIEERMEYDHRTTSQRILAYAKESAEKGNGRNYGSPYLQDAVQHEYDVKTESIRLCNTRYPTHAPIGQVSIQDFPGQIPIKDLTLPPVSPYAMWYAGTVELPYGHMDELIDQPLKVHSGKTK